MSSSPLRYPGGKSRLYGLVKKIIVNNALNDKTYVEPFAGGYGIGINLLINGDVSNFIINDYDYHIFAFWNSLFKRPNQLINLIRETQINIEEWLHQKEVYENYQQFSELEVAFSTLFLNRTNYSGILKSGPLGGYAQTGEYPIYCRFNKNKIISIIETLAKLKKQVKVYNMDAISLIKMLNKKQENIFYNFDPPYVVKGEELYTNFYTLDDHKKLCQLIKTLHPNWIMTYDNNELIRELYKNFNIKEIELQYCAGSKRKGTELLISNLRLD